MNCQQLKVGYTQETGGGSLQMQGQRFPVRDDTL